MTSLALVTAGHGTPSSTRLLGERLAEASVAALVAEGGSAEVTHLELRTLAADLASHLVTGVTPPKLRAAFDAICAADGVIAVAPIYNGAYSGLFKMFFDALDEGTMAGRPVLLGATGGTARHSLAVDHAMLPMFFYLKAPVAPHAVFAATKDWASTNDKLGRRIHRAATDFAQLVRASSPAKVSDEFEVTDFSELLPG